MKRSVEDTRTEALFNLRYGAAEAAKGPWLEDGRSWYGRAREFFGEIAERNGLPRDTVLGVVAALSPFIPWDIQLRDTEQFIRAELNRKGSGRHAGFKANIVKARRILRGVPAATVLSGPKVTAFYANLIGDESVVTLDRHAIAASFYRASRPDRIPGPRVLRTVQEAYAIVAAELGVTPAALQAIVWCWWRAKGNEECQKN